MNHEDRQLHLVYFHNTPCPRSTEKTVLLVLSTLAWLCPRIDTVDEFTRADFSRGPSTVIALN
jgi:hypothetical protein